MIADQEDLMRNPQRMLTDEIAIQYNCNSKQLQGLMRKVLNHIQELNINNGALQLRREQIPWNTPKWEMPKWLTWNLEQNKANKEDARIILKGHLALRDKDPEEEEKYEADDDDDEEELPKVEELKLTERSEDYKQANMTRCTICNVYYRTEDEAEHWISKAHRNKERQYDQLEYWSERQQRFTWKGPRSNSSSSSSNWNPKHRRNW